MTHYKIIQLSEEFKDQYQNKIGLDFEALKGEAIASYMSFANAEHLNSLDKNAAKTVRNAEGLNVLQATANITAGTRGGTHIDDTLQTGENKITYIAINTKTHEVEAILESANFFGANFFAQRTDQITEIFDRVRQDIAKENLSNIEVEQTMLKLQRNYGNPIVLDAVMQHALKQNPNKSHAIIVSYHGNEERQGFDTKVESSTMDSGTKCFYMLGDNISLIETLENNIINDSGEDNRFEVVQLG